MKRSVLVLAFVTLFTPAVKAFFWSSFTYTNICDDLCRCPDNILDAGKEALDCRDNDITSLPDGLTVPEGVTSLDFTRNHIQKIGPNTFSSNEMIKGIDFSANQLETLPGAVFQYFSDLEYLIFKNNKLLTINGTAFAGLSNLTKLDLSYNQLEVLPSELFAELTSLEELILDFNPLSDVNGIVLNKNLNLRSLYLSSTGIYTLHPDFLSRNLTKLSKLTLAYNNMIDVPSKAFFHIRDSLTYLDLSGNPLAMLGAYAFYGLSNLKTLRLNQMLKLELIDAFAFGDLTHLETCTLRYMPKIAYLDPKAFYGNKNSSSALITIEDFTFEFSVLSTLPEGLLNWDNLRYANLRYNHWYCDCRIQWIKNSSLLKLVGKNMVCSLPMRLRGHRVIDIPKEELNCLPDPHTAEQAPIGFVIGLMIAGIGVSLATVALLVYWRQGWLCRKPLGNYTHIERGVSEITVVDDMEWDNKDLQKD